MPLCFGARAGCPARPLPHLATALNIKSRSGMECEEMTEQQCFPIPWLVLLSHTPTNTAATSPDLLLPHPLTCTAANQRRGSGDAAGAHQETGQQHLVGDWEGDGVAVGMGVQGAARFGGQVAGMQVCGASVGKQSAHVRLPAPSVIEGKFKMTLQ